MHTHVGTIRDGVVMASRLKSPEFQCSKTSGTTTAGFFFSVALVQLLSHPKPIACLLREMFNLVMFPLKCLF